MRLLLDTHIALWALAGDPKLPAFARDLLLDADNQVLYSVASAWEVSIKHAAHPDKMLVSGERFVALCQAAGYDELPIASRHVRALETLRRAEGASAHHDPFDRIMVSQAKADGLSFVTHDALIAGYAEPCILRA